jgi:hypothetical protein
MGYPATSQPQAHVEGFSRISLGPNLRDVASAPAKGQRFPAELAKPNWMGEIVQCGRLCGAMIGGLGRPGSANRQTKFELRRSRLRHEAITGDKTSRVADLRRIW